MNDEILKRLKAIDEKLAKIEKLLTNPKIDTVNDNLKFLLNAIKDRF